MNFVLVLVKTGGVDVAVNMTVCQLVDTGGV